MKTQSSKSNIRCQIIVSVIDEPTGNRSQRFLFFYFLSLETVSQNSLCVTTKLAQVTVERENGCLGLTLRGGSEVPIIVTNVRAYGPAYKTSRIKPGDRVLRVDNVSFRAVINYTNL